MNVLAVLLGSHVHRVCVFSTFKGTSSFLKGNTDLRSGTLTVSFFSAPRVIELATLTDTLL